MFAVPGTPKGSRGPYWKFAPGSVSLFDRFGTKKGDPKKRQNRLFGPPFPSKIRVRTGRPKRSARGPQKCSPRHPRGPKSALNRPKVTEIDPKTGKKLREWPPVPSGSITLQEDAKFIKIKVRHGRLGALCIFGVAGSCIPSLYRGMQSS